MQKPRYRNPHQREIIDFWHSLPTPKPGFPAFALLCKDKGWSVNAVTLRQWRSKGYLPGDMNSPNSRKAADLPLSAKVNEIKVKALRDAEKAAAKQQIYSHDAVRTVAAKMLRSGEAMVERLITETAEVKITGINDLNVLANMTMEVFKTVGDVTKELQLLVGTELALRDVRADPVGLDEEVAEAVRRATEG
jgi:hypothetical protein